MAQPEQLLPVLDLEGYRGLRIVQQETVDMMLDGLARRAVARGDRTLYNTRRYLPSSPPSPANALFDQAWMRRLEKLGYERAQSKSAWDKIGSPYERPAH